MGRKTGKGSGSRKQRGRRKHPQKDKNTKETNAKALKTVDQEGTPLELADSFERPKGPVTPAKPVVIQIPAPSTNKMQKKTSKTDKSSKQETQKKDTKSQKEPDGGQKQQDEQREEIAGIPISEIPQSFPVNFDQRVGIFVDVQNMFYTAKHKYNRKLDFKRLIESIARKRRIVRAMAYIIEAPEIDQSQFKHVMEELGFELRIKDLRVRADGTAKGDWDMGIAIDTISMRDKIDVVALVSGDGDFTDLVYMLRSDGIRVEVYSFPSNTAEDLKRAATYYHPLDEGVLMKW